MTPPTPARQPPIFPSLLLHRADSGAHARQAAATLDSAVSLASGRAALRIWALGLEVGLGPAGNSCVECW